MYFLVLNWEQKKSDKTNQVFLNDMPVPPNNQIRLSVTNENGASEKSPAFLVKCSSGCGTNFINNILNISLPFIFKV
jgi:hypothetical protein